MSETDSHSRAKFKAAGKGGRTEVPLSGNRRLDALTAGAKRATEVERSGNPQSLNAAARRLASSGASQRILQVPHPHMETAAAAMRSQGVSGTVKNLGGTASRQVRPK